MTKVEAFDKEVNPEYWASLQAKRKDWAAYMRKRRQRHREWLEEINSKKRVAKSPVVPLNGDGGVLDALAAALIGQGQVLKIKNSEWSPELEQHYALELRRRSLETGRLDFLAEFKGRDERICFLIGLLRAATDGLVLFEQDSEGKLWVIPV